jgi:hypothetical protein
MACPVFGSDFAAASEGSVICLDRSGRKPRPSRLPVRDVGKLFDGAGKAAPWSATDGGNGTHWCFSMGFSVN